MTSLFGMAIALSDDVLHQYSPDRLGENDVVDVTGRI